MTYHYSISHIRTHTLTKKNEKKNCVVRLPWKTQLCGRGKRQTIAHSLLNMHLQFFGWIEYFPLAGIRFSLATSFFVWSNRICWTIFLFLRDSRLTQISHFFSSLHHRQALETKNHTNLEIGTQFTLSHATYLLFSDLSTDFIFFGQFQYEYLLQLLLNWCVQCWWFAIKRN